MNPVSFLYLVDESEAERFFRGQLDPKALIIELCVVGFIALIVLIMFLICRLDRYFAER
jgi:hypothetical protein